FVLNLARLVGTQDRLTVAIFSLEMSKEQLFQRMLTAEAGVGAERLRVDDVTVTEWANVSSATNKLGQANIFIDDTGACSPSYVRARCRRLSAVHGLHLVIIDNLQLVQTSERYKDRPSELSAIVRAFKALSKELNVPTVLVSQLSHASGGGQPRRPQLS